MILMILMILIILIIRRRYSGIRRRRRFLKGMKEIMTNDKNSVEDTMPHDPLPPFQRSSLPTLRSSLPAPLVPHSPFSRVGT